MPLAHQPCTLRVVREVHETVPFRPAQINGSTLPFLEASVALVHGARLARLPLGTVPVPLLQVRQRGRVQCLGEPPERHHSAVAAQPRRRQHQETRVVGHQVQTPELLWRRPTDPAVEGAQLEGAGLLADQRQPFTFVFRHMAQAPAEQGPVRQDSDARTSARPNGGVRPHPGSGTP